MNFKVSGSDVNRMDLLLAQLEKMSSKVFTDIEFNSIHRQVTPADKYYERDKVWIMSFCFPNSLYKSGKITELKFGKKIVLPDSMSDSYILEDEKILKGLHAVPLKDNEGGIFGCVIYNVAYIFFDLTHYTEEVGKKMSETDYTYLLKNIFKLIEDNVSPYTSKAKQKEYMTKFLNQAKASLDKKIVNMEEDKRNKENYIKDYIKSITTYTRDSMLISKEIELLKNVSFKDKTINALKNINKMSEVDYINFLSDCCVVNTKPLFIEVKNEYDGEKVKYDIGRYKISFFLDGKFTIVSRDKKNPDCGYEHPHIDMHHICLGSAGDVAKMIATYDYDAAVVVLLKFLQSYNEDGAYTTIETWFVRAFECKSDEEFMKLGGESDD